MDISSHFMHVVLPALKKTRWCVLFWPVQVSDGILQQCTSPCLCSTSTTGMFSSYFDTLSILSKGFFPACVPQKLFVLLCSSFVHLIRSLFSSLRHSSRNHQPAERRRLQRNWQQCGGHWIDRVGYSLSLCPRVVGLL